MEVLEDEPECRTVLLDGAVLGENPCDTIQTIRNGISSRPAIILMSGNCSDSAPPDCMDLVEDCIDLPVNPEQLKGVLESHLAEPETAQAG
jgi:DNA-binding response OmpR family regulator